MGDGTREKKGRLNSWHGRGKQTPQIYRGLIRLLQPAYKGMTVFMAKASQALESFNDAKTELMSGESED